MRIAFYLDSIKDGIEYKDPTIPNPGIGGTQYMIWTLSYYLQKKYEDVQVLLFAEKTEDLPTNMERHIAESTIECIEKCKENMVDYLILRGPFLKDEVIQAIDFHGVKVIVWSHNFENYISSKKISKCKNIIRNICVSYEQYDLLRDNELQVKSQVIYNGLNFDPYREINQKPFRYRVCYIGNLYPQSGYETLANAWLEIEKNCPQVELYIIGGNNLYNKDKMSGAYSSKAFKRLQKKIEFAFMDHNKKPKPNVHFMGVMGGTEKLKLMASAYVGIANLTVAGDTFGLSAVEFEALGVPVVSINKYGIRETVKNEKTGLLVSKRNELSKAVLQLLSDANLHDYMVKNCRNFVIDNFDINIITNKWYDILMNLNAKCPKIYRDSYFDYNNKKIIIINSKLKKIKIFHNIPSILFYKYLIYGAKRMLQKLNFI